LPGLEAVYSRSFETSGTNNSATRLTYPECGNSQ